MSSKDTKKPRVTFTKTIRLTREEVERASRLLPQYPECVSEADLLRQAALIGLYVLAAQATGQPAYGGYSSAELVALLKYRVLPAIDFLFEHDAFPALYREGATRATIEDDFPRASETQIVSEGADDLAELGTGFMDDD